MAPELFSEGSTHSSASDLWALGCVLYEAAMGRPPFLNSSFNQLVQEILHNEPAPIPGAGSALECVCAFARGWVGVVKWPTKQPYRAGLQHQEGMGSNGQCGNRKRSPMSFEERSCIRGLGQPAHALAYKQATSGPHNGPIFTYIINEVSWEPQGGPIGASAVHVQLPSELSVTVHDRAHTQQGMMHGLLQERTALGDAALNDSSY
eukprot:1154983-Pelagomonas_calceolata.AAC.3